MLTNNSAPVAGRLLTADEAADCLRISTRTLWTLTDRGELPCIRIGRSVRYRPADLASYCDRLAQVATQ
jgi:excisionase family DNA binding protein